MRVPRSDLMVPRPKYGQWIPQQFIIRPTIHAGWLSLPARILGFQLRIPVEVPVEDKSRHEQRKQTIVLYRP
jgi:hypothetical protein